MATCIVRSARPEDYFAVCALLVAQGLPSDEVTSDRAPRFYIANRNDGALLGCVALEQYGSDALLRSVAVAPAARGKGLGGTLVEFAEQEAAASGMQRLFLLTTSAHGYFVGLGYRSVQRSAASLHIRSTSQFSSLCPASAICMMKELDIHMG
jgi:amino-acid N-acetyltransferase